MESNQMKTVEYKFDIDEKVKCIVTGETGVICMLGLDDGGVQYFVKAKNASNWWKEKQIKKVK